MILSFLSKKLSNNKILLRIIAVAAAIGVADTVYLTADRYFGTGVQCFLLEGCEIVLKSRYSEIAGIPLAVLGLIFYIGIFVLINAFDIYRNSSLLKILKTGGVVGFVASVIFLSIQIFVLKAVCIYCLISFGSSTAIFIASRTYALEVGRPLG